MTVKPSSSWETLRCELAEVYVDALSGKHFGQDVARLGLVAGQKPLVSLDDADLDSEP